jgi:glycosyltransferase involved in cell wall biosynthesis
MRVLCLDIEGGYGGSSRSLFESVRNMPDDIAVEVWCRRQGPIQTQYAAIGVTCRVMPGMPHISSLPRLSRNLYAYARFAWGWPGSRRFRLGLEAAARERFDAVHCNHEGLFLLARWLRRRLGDPLKLTAHVRTLLSSTPFSRWQYRCLADAADDLVFITEMERDNVARLTSGRASGTVIYNIVRADPKVAPLPALAGDPRFKIGSVSNYAWLRGNDRLVDIAAALAARGRRDVLFVVAGRTELTGKLPGDLGAIARKSGTLADYARLRGVAEMFLFLGHVPDPAPVLAGCNILARPSRNYDPWGREVLEAMAAGLPVLATGTFNAFVENGRTGLLFPEFDAEAMASAIVDLADDPGRAQAMGTAAQGRVVNLCGGHSRAEDLARVWRAVVGTGPVGVEPGQGLPSVGRSGLRT